MKDNSEQQPSFDKLIDERKADGWDFVGTDHLRETKFVDGLFVETPVRSMDDIIKRQKQRLTDLVQSSGSKGEVEVELVEKPGQKFQDIEIPDKYGTYLIFARIKKK